MKFIAYRGHIGKENLVLPFVDTNAIEKFISDAITDKSKEICLEDVMVVPQEIIITAKSDNFITFEIKGALTIFAHDGQYPTAVVKDSNENIKELK